MRLLMVESSKRPWHLRFLARCTFLILVAVIASAQARDYAVAIGSYLLGELQANDLVYHNDNNRQVVFVQVKFYGVPAGSDCDTGHQLIFSYTRSSHRDELVRTVLCYNRLGYPDDDGWDDDDDDDFTSWRIRAGRTTNYNNENSNNGEVLERAIVDLLSSLRILKVENKGAALILADDDHDMLNWMRLDRLPDDSEL